MMAISSNNEIPPNRHPLGGPSITDAHEQPVICDVNQTNYFASRWVSDHFKGGFSLKAVQKDAMIHALLGKDIQLELPTGYGKTIAFLCAGLCRLSFLRQQRDRMNSAPSGSSKHQLMVVLSPLNGLTKQYPAAYSKLFPDFKFEAIGGTVHQDDDNGLEQAVSRVIEGHVDVLFLGPERIHQPERIPGQGRQNSRLYILSLEHCVK